MKNLMAATTAMVMLSGVAMAQSNSPPQPTTPPSTTGTTGAMAGSNGAAVAPNGGLKSGVGTTSPATGAGVTLTTPSAGAAGTTPGVKPPNDASTSK